MHVGECAGQRPPAATPSTSQPVATGADHGPIVWANWPAYIDKADGGRPTLRAFERTSGVDVAYHGVINDNEEYVASIATPLEAHRPVGADVFTVTNWMAAGLVQDGLVQRLPRIPNAGNLIDALAQPTYDPDREYSMPWQAGLTGVAYDARRVNRAIGSIAELFTRADLRGRVGLLTEYSDTIGMVLLSQGRDLATLSTSDLDNALDFLARAGEDGWVAGYYGNDFIHALEEGEVAACLAWSGDVLQAQLRNPYLKFVVPEEGLTIWSDDLLVPVASPHAGAVAEMIGWFYQPQVAARVAAWVNYICPVEGAQQAMELIDPDLALSPLIFPDSTILDRSSIFPTFGAEEDEQLRADFDDVISPAAGLITRPDLDGLTYAPPMTPGPRLMLLDTASLYFRAFFGVPDSITAPDGTPVNAVRGLLDFITRLVTDREPDRIVCCWDDDWRPAWRVELLESYKAHRVVEERDDEPDAEVTPDPLAAQIPVIVEALDLLGVPIVGAPDHEADDVIGTLATIWDGPVDVVTGDRDLFQLVDDDAGVRILYTARGVGRHDVVDAAWVRTKYGVEPQQYADFAVMRGDPSDGLPGVAGIGDKTAMRLLTAHGDLNGILRAAAHGEGPAAKQAARLAAAGDYLAVAPRVVRVVRDLVLGDVDGQIGGWDDADATRFGEFAERWGLGSSAERVTAALAPLARAP